MLGEIGADLSEVERLVEDVLTAARLEAGTAAFPLRREHVGGEELVVRAAERFRELRPDRGLAVDAAPRLPVLDADPVLLRRALDNLLDNAAKYSDGEVTLEARPEGTALAIAVRDRGIGISPEELRRLGTPFFRTAASRARGSGTGLGLALAKRIVEAHGGGLAIESAPGEGTTVTIRVPAAAARAARATA
jgi:signal transduction histidine kinase